MSIIKNVFATDVDGTVIRDNGTPHPETIVAFKKARDKGNIIIVASGRSLTECLPIVELLQNQVDYLVCNNGALIYDWNNHKELFLKSIKPSCFLEEFEFSTKNNIAITMHTNKNSYNWPKLRTPKSILLDNKLINKIKKFILENKDDNKLFNGETVTQLSLHATKEFCLINEPLLRKKYKGINNIFLTNGVFMDINPLNLNKWTGILYIVFKLGISLKNVYTFGDSGNDYEMLKNAKENGFPMENSTEDIKNELPSRIGSNNTNAIAKIVMKVIE